MTSRHEARIRAVQFLFQQDFNPGELTPALEEFWSHWKPAASVRGFAERLIRGVLRHQETLDEELRALADNWEVRRMGGVDRNVMRVALFELAHCEDIPPVVSVNEAVDIAKSLSSYESGWFVNGVLDRALRKVSRPMRAAAGTSRAPGGARRREPT
ncbi:MAG: transcription antitermination factor NusB [Candidatus Marinimicrobia bacterium]|nr:transcription antitermination factor NusB [Candidatus Neomarinimicrobiota bacterium]